MFIYLFIVFLYKIIYKCEDCACEIVKNVVVIRDDLNIYIYIYIYIYINHQVLGKKTRKK